MNTVEFRSLITSEKLLRALKARGYEEATPIQAQSIPYLIEGRDLLGIAQTGTGKTAAFALPMLQKLDSLMDRPQPRRPRSLILAPTRELVLQILEEFALLGKHTGVRCVKVIGGVGAQPQVKALSTGCDVLIATPGRLLDLANSRHVDLSQVATLVLDEADRLLDMGFIRDVKKIVKMTSNKRQTLLFSATMPKEVAELAKEILDNPIRVDVSPKQITVDKIDQRVVHVSNNDKQRMLETLLHDKAVTRAIVFTRTKHGANKVAKKLEQAGIVAEAIHGNKSQAARQRALASFKNGDCWVLVATDIAARGIDITGVSHVFNHELPHEPESYVHRIGRTARAGTEGIAVSLVDSSERPRLHAIEKLIKQTLSNIRVDLPPLDPSTEVVNTVPFVRSVTRNQQPARASGQDPSRRRRHRRVNTAGAAR